MLFRLLRELTLGVTLILCLPIPSRAELPVGQAPPPVVIDATRGGKVLGGPWTSASLAGKVHTLFYTDPDASELNNEAAQALRAQRFPRSKYGSVAVINMAATWIPKAAIDMKLRERQKSFPNTVFVRDLDKTLVKSWNLADDTSDILAFDRTGKVIFSRDGKLSRRDIQMLLAAIKAHL
jgi:predicted transcriptional regulator